MSPPGALLGPFIGCPRAGGGAADIRDVGRYRRGVVGVAYNALESGRYRRSGQVGSVVDGHLDRIGGRLCAGSGARGGKVLRAGERPEVNGVLNQLALVEKTRQVDRHGNESEQHNQHQGEQNHDGSVLLVGSIPQPLDQRFLPFEGRF